MERAAERQGCHRRLCDQRLSLIPSRTSRDAAPSLSPPVANAASSPLDAPQTSVPSATLPFAPGIEQQRVATRPGLAPHVESRSTSVTGSARVLPSLSPERAPTGSVAEVSTARPWQQAGGVATLAELFAAGVGLSSGAAQRAADEVGLAFGPSVLPSWLALKTARMDRSTVRDDESPRPAPALTYLSAESNRAVPKSAPSTARTIPALSAVNQLQKPVLPATAQPTATAQPAATAQLTATARSAATAQPAATIAVGGTAATFVSLMVSDSTGAESSLERPFAVDISRQAEILEKTTASSVSNALPNRGRLVGQIGGLAASSEAFARDHGVVRAEELFRSPVGSGDSASRLVSVVGGQVLVAGDVRRASEGRIQASPPAPSLSGAVTRRTDGFTSAPHAHRGEAWTDSGRMLPVAAWQRPGGLALRSELIASQLAGSPPWSSTLGASQWGRAPGLPSSLAQLFLSPQREEVQPRWAMGPQGLLFVAGPQPSHSAAQTVSPQTQRARETSIRPQASPATNAARVEQPGLIPTLLDSLVQAQQRSVTVPGLTPAAGMSPSSRESFSAVVQDGTRSAERTPAATMPWQSLGGMGALAELFATGVAMGTGSAGSVAQALGVSSGHSLAPDWLRQLMSRQASPELSERFAGLLPSLVFPSVFSSSGGATPSPKETRRSAGILGGAVLPPSFKSSDSTPSAARHPMGSLLAGGLAATAESFARQHGIERATTNEERAAQRGFGGDAEATAEPFGRWLPVAGGMVFVPKEYAKAAQPSGRRQDAPRTAGQPAPSAPSAATMATFAQLGGMALRSELFSALLGPQARQVGVDRFPSLTGWENIAALLTSLPQQQDAAESSLPRWAWSGAGGLMFLGAPSNVRQSASERVQLDPAAPVHRGGRTAGLRAFRRLHRAVSDEWLRSWLTGLRRQCVPQSISFHR